MFQVMWQVSANQSTDSSCANLLKLQNHIEAMISVTRLADFLDFGQLFKAFGNNYFAQIAHIFRQF